MFSYADHNSHSIIVQVQRCSRKYSNKNVVNRVFRNMFIVIVYLAVRPNNHFGKIGASIKTNSNEMSTCHSHSII